MRSLVVLAALAACGTTSERRVAASGADEPSATMTPSDATALDAAPKASVMALAPELEAELSAVRADPVEAVGFGEKAYIPYEPGSPGLVRADNPAVTTRLLDEARGAGDVVYRLAVTHLLGKRMDAGVDPALVALLADDGLRATAAYLLGRPGFKGYPARPRDLGAVLPALRAHVDDTGTFTDPFHRKTFRTQDFVLAAFIRLSGPEHFTFTSKHTADLIGLALPSFTDDERASLLAQIRARP